MKTIKDLMTPSPQFCTRNESLKEVAEKMAKNNIGSLPVVDENKKVIGMITDRDIALAIARKNNPADQVKVNEIMSPELYSLNQEDDASTALKMMRTKKVGRLPVLDNQQQLKGMVTLNSIVKKVKETGDKAEIAFEGKENVINTLESIAERDTEHIR
jgi:CBS domain-containing protein